MDNTRVIPSNGTPYEKLFKSSNGLMAQKTSTVTATTTTTKQRFPTPEMAAPTLVTGRTFDHDKGLPYAYGHGNGQAQILMNTPTIVTATNMQFCPPSKTGRGFKTKSLSSSVHSYCLPPSMQPIKSQPQNVSYLMPTSEFHMSQSDIIIPPKPTVTRPFSFMNMKIPIQSRPIIQRKIIQREVLVQRTSGPIIEHNPNYSQANHGVGNIGMPMKNGGGGNNGAAGESSTLVNTIKSTLFNFIIKPIIDTTTIIVGHTGIGKTTTNSGGNNDGVWNDMHATAGGSPMKNHQSSSTSSSFYEDCNHSNCENTHYFSNYMPDNFFDCDDYIEGGEDTIDFVADSTNIQYNQGFGHEFDAISQPSPKDQLFFDCVNKFEQPTVPEVVDVCEEKKQQKCTIASTAADTTVYEHLDVVSSTNISTDDENCKKVQYDEVENSPINCPKYEKPNPKSYRRKRRGKRKQQHQQNRNKSNNRAAKNHGHCNQKNRHEKIRHEVEQNIHDDIDDCSVVKDCVAYEPDDEDDEADLEIIDVDDDNLSPKCSTALNLNTTANAVTSKSNGVCIETPIPSPETIKSGCIFTKFFPWDNSNCKQKSLPLRILRYCMQNKVPQSPKAPRERPIIGRRNSETSESDDSFIVFEDNSPKASTSIDDLMANKTTPKDTYKRQRQISECSDDFIMFDDEADDLLRYDTTDEDFTDSTDDSDNSDDGKCTSFFLCVLFFRHLAEVE